MGKAKGRPPVYSQDELDRLLEACNAEASAVLTTLLLTGFRKQELCYLTWDDAIWERGSESLVVRRKPGFTPKDYEEREVPIPSELAAMLRAREHNSPWVFPSAAEATLHKFRHSASSRTMLPRRTQSGPESGQAQRLLHWLAFITRHSPGDSIGVP